MNDVWKRLGEKPEWRGLKLLGELQRSPVEAERKLGEVIEKMARELLWPVALLNHHMLAYELFFELMRAKREAIAQLEERLN